MSRDDAFLREAISLGDRLVESAYWNQDRANWICARRSVGPHGGGIAESLDPTIHVGTAGIALFLARLHLYSGAHGHRRAAEGAIRHSIEHAWFAEERPPYPDNTIVRMGKEWRFGFYLGTLGVAWAAHEVARLLGEPTLDVEAQKILDSLSQSRGAAEMDIMFGAAGGICALLHLEEEGFQGARRLADRLAARVLKGAYVRGDTWSWGREARDLLAKNLTGMSHGAAGIGHALARYYAASGREAYREAAQGAFNYERAVFDSDLQNWPYFLAPPQDPAEKYPAWCTWCHGAPGIGLSRIAAHPHLRDPRLRDDVRAARKTAEARLSTLLERHEEPLTLCCGALGVAECVWEMEDFLGVEGAVRRARAVGARVISRYGAEAGWGSEGWVDWPTGAPRGAHPGLLQGIAGIGHLMLRLHDPARIPSVLLPALPTPG